MTKNKSSGRTEAFIFGTHPVLETLKAGKRSVEALFASRDYAGHGELGSLCDERRLQIKQISPPDLTSLVGSPHHQGIAAKVGPFPYVDLDDVFSDSSDKPLPVVILDGVQDPVNLGNVLRVAECLGGSCVVIGKDRSVGVTPVAEKASAGAAAHVPVVRVVNLVRTIEQLRDLGFWMYAADAQAADTCYSADLGLRTVFVLGSEGKGLRRLVRGACDFSISIPLSGRVASLNVAQTAAVLLAETQRRRLGGGRPNPGP
ncbi:MAG: 23S rRNA (guanosine(2251)-2'-O)-methyltransferase RlmB [Pseudomonadota bacterium]